MNRFAAAAAFLAFAVGAPLAARAGGVSLTPSFAAELAQALESLAASDAPSRALIAEALRQGRAPSMRAFLATYARWCRLEGRQAARVVDLTQDSIAYLTRELGEPPGDENELREHYLPRAVESLGTAGSGAFQWIFEPDLVVVVSRRGSREICLSPSLSAAQQVEYLAHELVHFSRASSQAGRTEATKHANARDYALRAALLPGDEVDAYLFEWSLRVRRRGKRGLDARPFPQAKFNDSGAYLGTREEFSRFVVDELGYLKSRFEAQYRRALEAELANAEQRRDVQTKLLDARNRQVVEYSLFVRRRLRLFNAFSRSYRAESAKGRAYLAAAETSRDRLIDEIPKVERRIAAIRARLAANR